MRLRSPAPPPRSLVPLNAPPPHLTFYFYSPLFKELDPPLFTTVPSYQTRVVAFLTRKCLILIISPLFLKKELRRETTNGNKQLITGSCAVPFFHLKLGSHNVLYYMIQIFIIYFKYGPIYNICLSRPSKL